VGILQRFSRTKMLIGEKGLSALAAAKVVILGVGGVGSYAAEALVRAGIGCLRLVDHDVVDISNINRQLHALDSTVGKAKVAVLADRYREINPELCLEPIQEFYVPEQGQALLAGCDWVLDAVDTVAAKTDIVCSSLQAGRKVISCMGTGNKLDAALLRVDDISKTVNCPLARSVRRELGKQGIRSGVPVVWSPELPQSHEESQSPRIPASISYVPAAAGLLMASYVVNRIIQLKS
jgi:tRNA A37 threonylcarbamoyladenosine dehydratase